MFIKEEIAEKKKRVRQLMAELKLDALLLRRTANFAWLTGGGINYVGYTTDFGVSPVLFTDDGEYIVSNNIEAPRLQKEESVVEQGYKHEIYSWHNDSGEADILSRLVAGKKTSPAIAPIPAAPISAARWRRSVIRSPRGRWNGTNGLAGACPPRLKR